MAKIARQQGVRLSAREQECLVKLMHHFSPRAIHQHEATERGLATEFHVCKNAGLIQSAGFECSVRGDEWLESPAGRTALASHLKGD